MVELEYLYDTITAPMKDYDAQRGKNHMNPIGLIVLAVPVVTLILLAYHRAGMKGIGQGFAQTGTLALSILPYLALGITLAGFLTYLLPQEIVARWLGAEAGLRAIGLGCLAGVVIPGGPFIHYPILASLLARGAALGPVAAYIAAWGLMSMNRVLVWESPFFGWRFVGIRLLASLVFPFLIGVVTQELTKILSP